MKIEEDTLASQSNHSTIGALGQNSFASWMLSSQSTGSLPTMKASLVSSQRRLRYPSQTCFVCGNFPVLSIHPVPPPTPSLVWPSHSSPCAVTDRQIWSTLAPTAIAATISSSSKCFRRHPSCPHTGGQVVCRSDAFVLVRGCSGANSRCSLSLLDACILARPILEREAFLLVLKVKPVLILSILGRILFPGRHKSMLLNTYLPRNITAHTNTTSFLCMSSKIARTWKTERKRF